ncbi:hypothetical protein DSO57_1006779, partial [Entomophthora muscae]
GGQLTVQGNLGPDVNHIRELEKLLKNFNLAITKIKEINCKVKEKVKSSSLTGKKIDKVLAKALMAKMPDISEKTIEHLLNTKKL